MFEIVKLTPAVHICWNQIPQSTNWSYHIHFFQHTRVENVGHHFSAYKSGPSEITFQVHRLENLKPNHFPSKHISEMFKNHFPSTHKSEIWRFITSTRRNILKITSKTDKRLKRRKLPAKDRHSNNFGIISPAYTRRNYQISFRYSPTSKILKLTSSVHICRKRLPNPHIRSIIHTTFSIHKSKSRTSLPKCTNFRNVGNQFPRENGTSSIC